MKCRQWGHFANVCSANTDTCGTCGSPHRINVCDNREKTYCVSCRAHDHASWNRGCPKFQCRCSQFDENYPENNLPYFPIKKEWTLIPCPNRIPLMDRFLAKCTVSGLLPPPCNNCPSNNKAPGKQRKQNPANVPENQVTMDKYIRPNNRQGMERLSEPNHIVTQGMDVDLIASLELNHDTFGASPILEGWE